MSEVPAPLDEATFLRLIRYGLRTGAEQLHLRPGYRPMVAGLGGARELRHRQLTGDDTRAVAAHLFAQLKVSDRLRDCADEAARELYWFVELPSEALLEVHLESAPGGLAVALDIIRPLGQPPEEALTEA